MEERITYKEVVLPAEHIIQSERDRERTKIAQVSTYINSDLKQAIENEGLKFDLATVKEVYNNEDALSTIMSQRYADYVKGVSYAPKEEMNRIRTAFDDVACRLQSVASDAHALLNQYTFDLVVVKGKIMYDEKQVDEYICTTGIRTFSDKEKEYVRLLNEATAAIINVANFEITNNLEDYALSSHYGLAYDAKSGKANIDRIIKGINLRHLPGAMEVGKDE